MTRLTDLEISETEVGAAGLEHLKGLTNIEMLFIHKTRVTEGAVTDLKRALPKLGVYK